MRKTIATVATLLLGVALLGLAPSNAAAAFLEAWAKVPSYTTNIKVHMTRGTDVQDRTYHYAYLKPHFAKIDITGGPGRGGGAVWKGGTTVTGHRGGAISWVRLTKSLHDPETVDLRGHSLDQASFESIAQAIEAGAITTRGRVAPSGGTLI